MPTQIPTVEQLPSSDSQRIVLIDADIFRYQVGAIMTKHPFVEGEFIPAPPEHICKQVDLLIESILEDCGTSQFRCFFTGKGNFRDEIATLQPYKGNRDPSVARPYHFKTVEEHILATYPAHIEEGREADDILAEIQFRDWFKVMSSGGEESALSTIIASRDKDLRNVPGMHYSWACGENQPVKPLRYISIQEALSNFYYQMLIGDNTDNIIGCGMKHETKWGWMKDEEGNDLLDEQGNKVPRMMMRRKGVGSSKAIKIINSCDNFEELHDKVHSCYVEVFGVDDAEKYMLENARLLHVGHSADNLFEWSWLDPYMKETIPEFKH